MQTLTKRLGAVMLAAVLLVALACGGVMAWAQDDDAAVAGENTLTVNANVEAPGETATINVNVDVYQIATAAKDPQFDTYHYTFIDPTFSALNESYDEQNMTGAKWQALADEAVKLIDGVTPVAKGEPTGTKISGLSNGLFLVVAADVTGNVYKYSFNPTIVALPTKEPLKDDQGNVVVEGRKLHRRACIVRFPHCGHYADGRGIRQRADGILRRRHRRRWILLGS